MATPPTKEGPVADIQLADQPMTYEQERTFARLSQRWDAARNFRNYARTWDEPKTLRQRIERRIRRAFHLDI
jgi:hypothetical protein